MIEGFWGNYQTGKYFLIDEHEHWIRRGNNAELLGVSAEVIAQFGDYPTRMDLLPFLFHNAPVMRWRGHGESVTFEFDYERWDAPLSLIQKWGDQYAGPFLYLRIVNFHSGMKVKQLLWKDFTKMQEKFIQ